MRPLVWYGQSIDQQKVIKTCLHPPIRSLVRCSRFSLRRFNWLRLVNDASDIYYRAHFASWSKRIALMVPEIHVTSRKQDEVKLKTFPVRMRITQQKPSNTLSGFPSYLHRLKMFFKNTFSLSENCEHFAFGYSWKHATIFKRCAITSSKNHLKTTLTSNGKLRYF